jgi:hypothetical protein
MGNARLEYDLGELLSVDESFKTVDAVSNLFNRLLCLDFLVAARTAVRKS